MENEEDVCQFFGEIEMSYLICKVCFLNAPIAIEFIAKIFRIRGVHLRRFSLKLIVFPVYTKQNYLNENEIIWLTFLTDSYIHI